MFLKLFAVIAIFQGHEFVLDSGLYEDECGEIIDTAPGLVQLEPGFYVERPALVMVCRDYLPGQAPGTVNPQ